MQTLISRQATAVSSGCLQRRQGNNRTFKRATASLRHRFASLRWSHQEDNNCCPGLILDSFRTCHRQAQRDGHHLGYDTGSDIQVCVPIGKCMKTEMTMMLASSQTLFTHLCTAKPSGLTSRENQGGCAMELPRGEFMQFVLVAWHTALSTQ
eukprot:1159801-Pelagomonas_calceolata.AAC.4